MTAFTNYTENEILKHIFRTGSFVKPTALYVGLMSSLTDGEAGTVTELSGGGYARVNNAPLDANWTDSIAGNGTTTNAAAITFPAATADWTAATHFGIWDAATAGNLLIYASLGTLRTITNGAVASFGPGTLTVQVDT